MYSIRQRQGNTIKIIEIGLGPQSQDHLKAYLDFGLSLQNNQLFVINADDEESIYVSRR